MSDCMIISLHAEALLEWLNHAHSIIVHVCEFGELFEGGIYFV